MATDAELQAVSQAFRALSASAESGIRSIELARADALFHGSVIALSGSARIREFYQRIGSEMTFAITLLQREDAATSEAADHIVAEHRPIHDAIVARDALKHSVTSSPT